MDIGEKLVEIVPYLIKKAKTRAVIRTRDLVSEFGVSSSGAAKALRKQARLGLLEKIADGTYLNTLAVGVTARDIVNELEPHSYVSFRTALADGGISSQAPVATTCVNLSRSRTVTTKSFSINYRKISKRLFWGYTEKKARYSTYKIAEPEKALLDWIYFNLQEGLPVQLDEIHLHKLDRPKLIEYAKKYPSTVLQTLFLPLIEIQLPKHP